MIPVNLLLMHAPVTYSIIEHHKMSRIAVQFEYNEQWNKRMGKVRGAKWSKTMHCWHIPDTEENRKKCGIIMNSNIGPAITGVHTPAVLQDVVKLSTKEALCNMSPNNSGEMKRFLDQLALKAYSPSTIRTYRNEFAQLLQILGTIQVQDLKPEHLQRYLLYCIKNGLKENTVHSRINALKFYYEQVLHEHKMFFEIPRPKKPLVLPKLLNEDELRKLFNALTNKKHKAMMFTAYSGGLRVSEVANLKIADIDSKRMQIFIERSKGKKDRYVNLSPLLLDILRKYVSTYKPAPKVYLFESEVSHTAYPVRTLQRIFQLAKAKAGISKEVGVHSLRHSFATHLLEKGTDIKYIKELLGHFDIKTTERYLHVSRKKLVNIASPLDDLYMKDKMDW